MCSNFDLALDVTSPPPRPTLMPAGRRRFVHDTTEVVRIGSSQHFQVQYSLSSSFSCWSNHSAVIMMSRLLQQATCLGPFLRTMRIHGLPLTSINANKQMNASVHTLTLFYFFTS